MSPLMRYNRIVHDPDLYNGSWQNVNVNQKHIHNFVFALSVTIYEIFTNHLNFQKFYLENEGQDEKGNGTCAIRFEMFESILVIFSKY